MRSIIYIIVVSLGMTGCLNNDVLDKDLENTNFKESDFYTSGDFDNQFGFTVESVALKTIVNPFDPSDTLCNPTYTLRLNDNFVAGLTKEWSDQVILTLYKDNMTPEVEYIFDNNYGQFIEFEGKAMECNSTSSDFDAQIVLVAPNTGRATASIQRKTMQITFTP